MQKLIRLTKKYHYLIVAGLLGLMFGLGVTSMAHDSAIADEVAHIPAAYSYLHFGDYRLNPEHPPLIKDLAAAPLQFLPLSFPTTTTAWTKDVNNQWIVGRHFLYYDGNNASQILFYSRLPILILAIVFGAVFYEVARRKFGVAVGLLSVFFYSLDPNILAHARYVTTDIGAAATIFIAIVCFVNFMQKPNYKTGSLAAIFLAIAELSKFSAVLLPPLYAFLVLVAVVSWSKGSWVSRLRQYGWGLLAVGSAALVLVWLYYIANTIHMSAETQQHLVTGVGLHDWKLAIITRIASYNHLPGAIAFTQYVLGILMVLGRVAGGNTTFFLGKVSNQSFLWYFPVTFMLKTPLAMLVLITICVASAVVGSFRKPFADLRPRLQAFCQHHFLRLAAVSFIALYIVFSMSGNLDLGIRHLMPIFPFVFLLVAYEVVYLGRKLSARQRILPGIVLALLMGYLAYANFSVYPSYIAYFNELIGSPNNASKYLSDSNVDWGQDLLRLQDYIAKHHIAHIAVDYFGGDEPQYRFCDRRYSADGTLIRDATGFDCSHSPYLLWDASKGIYAGQYMAVSETDLMSDLYINPHPKGNVGYARLRAMKPVAQVGHSIYVYKLH